MPKTRPMRAAGRVFGGAGHGVREGDEREVVADPGRRAQDEVQVGDGLVERGEGPGGLEDGLGVDGRAPGRGPRACRGRRGGGRRRRRWPGPGRPGRCSRGCPDGRGRRPAGRDQTFALTARL
ncbi:MAG: hypothetical protein MZV64_18240 [Ignavibacteriales bacterium]|nr:hypothetical protein [Ignavibacteriales bacterium]